MSLSRIIFIFVCIVSLPIGAAKTEAGADTTLEIARQKLQASRPDLPIKEFRPSKVEGIFEVVLGSGMTLYMNETADYLIAGDLYFVTAGGLVNATEADRIDTRRELLSGLDASEMIVFSPPAQLVKTTVTVFTDIDCGYCRKLHQEVPELNRMGIAVRYLAYPRAGIGSASYDKAVTVWCSENPEIALTQAKAGTTLEPITCVNPVAAQYGLGDKFGVTGTPAVFYEDGTLQSGYMPAADMAERLGIN